MVAVYEGDDVELAQLDRVKRIVLGEASLDGDVASLRGEARLHPRRARDLHRDPYPRKPAPELRDQRHRDVGSIGGDAQRAPDEAFVGAEQLHRAVFEREQLSGDGGERVPEVGGLDPAALPAQERHVVGVLQGLDVARHRRLGDVQPPGGLGDAAGAGDGVEGAKLDEVHREV